MTASEELAAMLNGREYLKEITDAEARLAKANGLVVVFGQSDDLMEFAGAIGDEVGCFNGGTAYLNSAGLLQNSCDDHDCPYFAKEKAHAATIEALWCKEPGYSFTYKTDIPHVTFEIVEDGDPYCRGIVFALADVGKPASTWQSRLIAERVELDARLVKLEAFLKSSHFATNPTVDAIWLHEQAAAMRVYSLALDKRIKLLIGGAE